MSAGYLAAVAVRARHLVPRPIRRAASHVLSERRAAEIERHLAALAADSRPIVVGPWLGEVGFELLYWIPFVRWFVEQHAIPAERLIVVTRGGAASWYSPLALRALDALSCMTVEQFRTKNAHRAAEGGEQKQVAVSALDEDLLDQIRRTAAREFTVLHPSVMYRLFAPYWWGHEPIQWVRRYTRYVRLERPPALADLPAGYTAVKFYSNDCFHATPANRAFANRTIRRLADRGPVVLLTSGAAIDDHAVCDEACEGVLRVDGLLSPQTNLLVQSAVVAGARAFVGTYGGFAYLAPSFGVPASTYYASPTGFAQSHLDLARAVFEPERGDLLRVEAIAA